MGDDSLLDEMLRDHETQQAEAPRRDKAIGAMAGQLDATRRAMKEKALREEWNEAERRAARRAESHDTAPELAGFRPGSRFELRGNRPELQGVWVVERVDSGAAGDASRRLYARREKGGEGFLPLTERQIQDLVHFRVITRLD